MSELEQSIEVNVPVSTAYNQWTQFEEFPRFMEGIEKVHQIDDETLHWVASIAGIDREWDAKIVEQVPDQRIAWRNIDGATNAGVVTFHKLDDTTTKVMLQLDFEPEGLVEQAADKLGIIRSRTKGDLERFKAFLESRGSETGAWRGEIQQDTGAGSATPPLA